MRKKLRSHHKHHEKKPFLKEQRLPLFRKGQFMMGGRKIISIILGLILLILGGVPLLNRLGVIKFTLPPIPEFILWTAGMVGAVVLIVDAFQEMQEFGFGKIIMAASIIVAVVIFLYGLNAFTILPFAMPALGALFVYIVLLIAGILLVIGGFIGF